MKHSILKQTLRSWLLHRAPIYPVNQGGRWEHFCRKNSFLRSLPRNTEKNQTKVYFYFFPWGFCCQVKHSACRSTVFELDVDKSPLFWAGIKIYWLRVSYRHQIKVTQTCTQNYFRFTSGQRFSDTFCQVRPKQRTPWSKVTTFCLLKALTHCMIESSFITPWSAQIEK